MKLKGKIIRWNEDRGFGFIKSPSVKGDVFIHISELKKMSRRPQIDDILFFDTVTDKKGKTKAVNAKIEGVSEITVKRKNRKPKGNTILSRIFSFLVVLGVAFVAYVTFPIWSKSFINSVPVNLVKEDFTSFSCQGKQYCSQMTSCKEARFYLKNCPNVKIDGDNNGVPCESQWCN